MSVDNEIINVKTVVPGLCRGKLLVVDRYISFFGEVDPNSGCLKEEAVCLPSVVLAFRGTRGSTVAPYIIYALKKNGKNPVCMIVKDVEPMLVTGCVIADIPLYQVLEYEKLVHFNGYYVEVEGYELRMWKNE